MVHTQQSYPSQNVCPRLPTAGHIQAKTRQLHQNVSAAKGVHVVAQGQMGCNIEDTESDFLGQTCAGAMEHGNRMEHLAVQHQRKLRLQRVRKPVQHLAALLPETEPKVAQRRSE